MAEKKYLLAESTIDETDIESLVGWLRGNPWLTQGPVVREFERGWAAWSGHKHALFVNSGSSANLIMYADLLESGRPPNKKVIVPAVSWATTVAPAIQLGFEPIMCDADPTTFGLDLAMLDALCNEHQPAAVIAVPRPRRPERHGRADGAEEQAPLRPDGGLVRRHRLPLRRQAGRPLRRAREATRSTSAITSRRSRAGWCAPTTIACMTSGSTSGATAGEGPRAGEGARARGRARGGAVQRPLHLLPRRFQRPVDRPERAARPHPAGEGRSRRRPPGGEPRGLPEEVRRQEGLHDPDVPAGQHLEHLVLCPRLLPRSPAADRRRGAGRRDRDPADRRREHVAAAVLEEPLRELGLRDGRSDPRHRLPAPEPPRLGVEDIAHVADVALSVSE